MKLYRFLSATALVGVVAAIPNIASARDLPSGADTAQSAQAASADTAKPDDEPKQDIVVTGSRIRRPNLDSAVPITSITSDDIFNQAQNNLGDTLNDLPQLRSTFAQQNPGAGVGITGLNLLDLRGLGTARTLVLVNGRRHVAADILNNAVSPDVNTISNDLIERVDVVTGGNSAVYGSDAIAGVVNFVLRRDFNGLQVRGSAGLSEPGYGGNQYISGMYGKNFADGRGNITVQAEFANQRRIYASDIPVFRQANGFATVDVDPTGLPQGSDGFPDAQYFTDLRSATTNRFGMAFVPQPKVGGACGYGTSPTNGPPDMNGTPFDCAYVFSPDGTLQAQTGTRFGTGPLGSIVGGNGQTSREGTQLSILPSNRRYNINLLAHFQFSPALELFFEGKYSDIHAVGNQLGPTFLNNSTGSLGSDVRLDPRLDNPFLNPAARTLIANAYTAANCGYTLGLSVSAATCVQGSAAAQAARAAAIADGSYRFLFARNLTDTPDRDEFFHRQTYRFVAGARGDFLGTWNYELSVNYGKFIEHDDLHGFVDRQRFLLSLDAGRNPATGAIQCRSQFDPASAYGAPGLSGSAASAAKLAADIAACVPYNLFGQGNNQAASAYFSTVLHNHSSLEQFDVTGFINGDTGKLFSLPGGPVSFVLGGEYRREKAFNISDDAANTGISNGVFLGNVDAPALQVKEAFGELNLPIVKDLPFFNFLNFSAAGRISNYNTAAGTAYSYNLGYEWSPFPALRLRGNYGRAVRAPNISESGFPNVPNFSNGFVDPCSVNAIAQGTAARVTNCNTLSAAQLANLPLAGYSLGVISGSNPNLKPELSDSYTVGGVIEPHFLRGFSLSVDYYAITVNNVIVTLSAQQILNACYDTPGFNSPLCGAFKRNLTNANGPYGELPGQVLFYTTIQGPQNFARRVRKGIDVEMSYNHTFSSDWKLSSRLIYTHALQSSNFQNPTIPNLETTILGTLGDPKNEFRFNADVTYKAVTFGYGMHYIGPMLTSTFENFYPNNAGVPGQTGLPLNSDAFSIYSYPSVVYHDVRLDFRIGDHAKGERQLNFYFGVDNITDQQPPLGSTATGAGSAIYSIRGRAYYAGFKALF